ncbi:MAG: NAC family transcription factor [Anaerolineae bacterium]
MMWRMASCCGGSDEVTQVDIRGDGMTIGITGLKAAFEQLYALGLDPDDSIQDELLAMVQARNYVPRSAEEAYKSALLREYAAFCTKKRQEDG